MNALIVCHAGLGMGLGHLTRSLVVAHALQQELNLGVKLLIQGDAIKRDDLDEFAHQFMGVEENLANKILQQAKSSEALVVALDLHPRLVPTDIDDLLKELRRGGRKVVGVDGLVKHRANLDLIFIPSFRFFQSESAIGETPILFGWDSFLLNVKHTANDWKKGNQVLALAGGSDATNLGKTMPVLLNESLPSDTELHWVTGPYAQQPNLPVSPRISILNHQSPSSLDDLMIGANYAVTAYGVSFFELIYYGVPTVVFSPYGNKDDAELAAITVEGVALVARDEVDAVAKLKKLMADDALAASLSACARQRLSVMGGRKLAQAVERLIA